MDRKGQHLWFQLSVRKPPPGGNGHVTSTVQIPEAFRELFQDHLSISCGRRSVIVETVFYDGKENRIICPANVFERLSVSKDVDAVSAMYCRQKRKLVVGPIIGLLTEGKKGVSTPGESIEQFFRELKAHCNEHSALCFLYLWQEFQRGGTIGYDTFHNEWIKGELPFPHFVYNRIHSRKIQYSHPFSLFLRQLGDKVSFYNKTYLSKKDVYDLLSANSRLRPYLPEGRLGNRENLLYFTKKYDSFFAKPIYGSLGRGIIRIGKRKKGWIVEHVHKGEITKGEFFSVAELLNYFSTLTTKETYWLQAEVPLLHFRGRIADFRILTHLLPDQTWTATSLSARISEHGSFITNVSQGGDPTKAKSLLSAAFPRDQAEFVYEQLTELALEVSRTVAEKMPDTFIELGIDAGVNDRGQIQLIEINSKPSKKDTNHSGTVRPSAKAIGNIALYYGKKKMEEGCPCRHSEL